MELGGPTFVSFAVLVLFLLPGTVLVRSLTRISLIESIALGAPISLVLLAFLGGLLGLLGVPASLTTVSVAVAIFLLMFLLLRRLTPSPTDPELLSGPALRSAWLGAALAAGVAAITWGRPGRWVLLPPQSWDDMWHQYVVSTISRRGLMGPQNMIPIDGLSDATTVYQFAAHLPAGLASAASLDGTVAGLNSTLWVASVILLPIGVAALAAFITDRRLAILLAPTVVHAAPDLVFGQVGSFPLTVGFAMIPAMILGGLRLLTPRPVDIASVSVFALVSVGLLLVHPHAFVTGAGFLAITWVLVAGRILSPRHHDETPDWSWLALALCLLGAVIIASPWFFVIFPGHAGVFHGHILGSIQIRDAGFTSASEVLRAVFEGRQLGETLGSPNRVFGGLLFVAPLYLAVRRKHPGLLLAFVMFLAMTVITAADGGSVREIVGGIWLGDWWRPAAAVGLSGGLLIALAMGEAGAHLRSASRHEGLIVLAGLVLIVLLTLATVAGVKTSRQNLDRLHGPLPLVESAEGTSEQPDATPAADPSEPLMLISPQEIAAFEVLAEVSPPGTRVMNWWADGSPWMYSAGGLVPVQTYGLWSIDPEVARDLEEHLVDPTARARVLSQLADLRVCSAFVGEGHLTYQTLADRPPWTLEGELPGFELIYSNPHARVYRATDPMLLGNC